MSQQRAENVEPPKGPSGKFISRIGKLPDFILIVLMAVILLDLVAGTVSRYLGRHSFTWTEELGTFCFLWVTFIGSAVGVMKGSHFVIPVFVERMPPMTRYILQMVGCLAMGIFSVLLIISGVKIVRISTMAVSHTLEIPMTIPFASLPVGGALMLLCSILLMGKTTRSFRRERQDRANR